jgi:Helix-turn-helix domain
MFNRTFGCVRVVWNRTLAGRQRRWQQDHQGTTNAQTPSPASLGRPRRVAYRAGACAVAGADKASRKRTVADTVS